jgi:hypothetical protein
MQAARLLATIKKHKDAAGTRFIELHAHYGSLLGRFARIAYFAEPTKSNSITNPKRVHFRSSDGQDQTFTTIIRSISDLTVVRLATPGRSTSGSTTFERVGQNSGWFFHCVPDSSGHAPSRISQLEPFDLTIVVHFGHRVCIPQICHENRLFSSLTFGTSQNTSEY